MIIKNINGNNISQGFIDEIQSDSPTTIARFMLNGSEVSCDIVGVTAGKGSCGSETFSIGCVYGDILTATVKGLSTDIKGQELDYQIGVLVNDSYEYISLGRFTVSEVKKTRYQQEITAYSSIVSKSGDTLTPFLTSTPTLAQLGSKIAGQIGCLVKYDSDINTSLQITAPLDGNLTVYNGIEILALCCGGYAINDNEGNILIKRYNAIPTLNVDTGMMTKLPEIAEQPYCIESVAVEVADATYDADGKPVNAVYVSRLIKKIQTHTGLSIKTHTNKYLVAGQTTDNADLTLSNKYVTDLIFSENILPIIGYEYYPADVHLTLGDPRLEGSDVLYVADVDGTEYVVPCHQITHTYKGAIVSDIKSATANDKANDIGTAMPITARLDKVERKTEASNQTADNAMKIAGNNNQYFWFVGSGEDTGAHITETPQEQFLADPENGGGNLLARSNGIACRDGLEELATFSQNGSQIGRSGQTRILQDYHSQQMIDKEGMTYFFVSDLRGSDGKLTLTDTWITNGTSNYYYLRLPAIDTSYVVKVNGLEVATTSKTTTYFAIQRLEAGNVVTAEYTTESQYAKAYTLGIRNSSSDVGIMSHAEGQDISASGSASHAEGRETTASGSASHAEGDGTIASGITSHAEGDGTIASGSSSHAEGMQIPGPLPTTASGEASHAEGQGTTASGRASHSEGLRTVASGQFSHAEGVGCEAGAYGSHAGGYYTIVKDGNSYQTAIGKYNKSRTDDLFEVGNGTGTSDGDRSNALQLDVNGNMSIAGTLTQGSDRRLKEHIDYLDDDAVEFIRKLKPAHYIKDDEHHVGFYAQDVEEADEWDCMTGEMNGYMTLGYTELIAPLVAYVQKLEKRIEELERSK